MSDPNWEECQGECEITFRLEGLENIAERMLDTVSDLVFEGIAVDVRWYEVIRDISNTAADLWHSHPWCESSRGYHACRRLDTTLAQIRAAVDTVSA
jgi:hypothetical protein